MKFPKSFGFGIISLFFISIFLTFSITHSFFISPATSQSTEKAQASLDLVDFALKNGLTKLNCFSGSYMGPKECRKPSRCLEAIERLDSIVLSRGSSSSVKEMEDWINRASQNKNCAIAIGGGPLVSNVKRAFEAIQDSARITSLPSVARCPENNITIRPNSSNLAFKRGTEWNPCPNYKFIFQNDGNLVLYSQNRSIWATGTNNKADLFVVQADGNVVLYGGGRAVWATNTHGNPGAFLAIQSDGNLVVYDRNGNALWSSGTRDR